MLKTLRPDSCVLASRVAIDVLSHYGYAASPHPVAIMASNDVRWQAMQSGRDGPWVDKAGGYSVGVGRLPTSNETRHLVVVVPAQLKMIDLSLDQFSRPEKGIPLQPTWFDIHPEWSSGSSASMALKSAHGVHLYYEHGQWSAFASSVDWLNPKRAQPFVRATLAAIEARIDHPAPVRRPGASNPGQSASGITHSN